MAHERFSQYGGEPFAESRESLGLGRAGDFVDQYPGYSALACFGLGMAVGAVVTMLLTPAKRDKAWYEDYLPDEGMVEDVAYQVRETVQKMLPDALARYFKRR